jgi:hypothetical protein
MKSSEEIQCLMDENDHDIGAACENILKYTDPSGYKKKQQQDKQKLKDFIKQKELEMKKLSEVMPVIQANLKAPKNQFNKFGGYAYRSCEDIMEGLKPLMEKYGFFVKTEDEIVQIGDRVYVKATASAIKGDEIISTTAYAREAIQKKGMDESQVTGSTSSYARKYALNGLFAIDDQKDADHQDNRQSSNSEANKPPQAKQYNPSSSEKASVKQINLLKGLVYDKYNGKENVPQNILDALPQLSKKAASQKIEQLKKEQETKPASNSGFDANDIPF